MTEGAAPPSGRAQSPEQVAGLRRAFAEEVTARVEPLLEAADRLAGTGDVAAARVVSAHAHVFASNAVILGEDLAAFHARRCEQALLPHLDAGVDVIPADAAAAAAEAAATLGVLLAPWVLGAVDDAG